jgi:hypothetical protein
MMDLRDQFAMAAMQGELAGQSQYVNWSSEKQLSKRAYEIADAMLAERERLGEARKQEILGAKL